jgi:hypothetical protein
MIRCAPFALAALSAFAQENPDAVWRRTPVDLRGRVVNEEGLGVRARVEAGRGVAEADARGYWKLEGLTRRNTLLLVKAEGQFTELRVAELEAPSGEASVDLGTIRLRARQSGRARIVFGGDTMMGRRFLKPEGRESPSTPRLAPDSTAADSKRLLADVAPFLRECDAAVVNLETVVADAAPGDAARKAIVLLTPPAALEGLVDAGVAAVTLGNNHVWDYGRKGFSSTVAALERRKVAWCGAGDALGEAREDARLSLKGYEFRIRSYCGVSDLDRPADAVPWPGGPAPMDPRLIAQDVAASIKQGAVVVSLHSGIEYSERPTRRQREAARAAADAGAALVVGHHPHCLQGLAMEDATLVARSLGNFLFDQTRWETLPGILLVVDFEDGRVAEAHAVPIVNDDFVPRPAAGPMARWTVRRLGALSDLPVYWEAGRAVVGVETPHRYPTSRLAMLSDVPAPAAHRDPAASLAAAPAGALLGRDLLRVGGFEGLDADGDVLDPGVWELSKSRRVTTSAARSGAAGLAVVRKAGDRRLAAATRLRIPVPATFTIAGWTKAENAGDARVECDWCAEGSMEATSRLAAGSLPAGRREWTFFHFDVERPAGAFSMRLRLSCGAPETGEGVRQFDDLAVIAWEAAPKTLRVPNDWSWIRMPGRKEPGAYTLEYEHFEDR